MCEGSGRVSKGMQRAIYIIYIVAGNLYIITFLSLAPRKLGPKSVRLRLPGDKRVRVRRCAVWRYVCMYGCIFVNTVWCLTVVRQLCLALSRKVAVNQALAPFTPLLQCTSLGGAAHCLVPPELVTPGTYFPSGGIPDVGSKLRACTFHSPSQVESKSSDR